MSVIFPDNEELEVEIIVDRVDLPNLIMWDTDSENSIIEDDPYESFFLQSLFEDTPEYLSYRSIYYPLIQVLHTPNLGLCHPIFYHTITTLVMFKRQIVLNQLMEKVHARARALARGIGVSDAETDSDINEVD